MKSKLKRLQHQRMIAKLRALAKDRARFGELSADGCAKPGAVSSPESTKQ